MGKYEDYVSKFNEDYEQPVAEEYIVGFSGLDPDKKVKPETISHEKLDGLLGGDFAGRYHVTHEQLREFVGYRERINQLSASTTAEFALVRKETADGLREVRDEAGRKIESLRTTTNEKIDALSRACTSEIARVEREAAQALGETSEELSAEIKRVDDKTVEAISRYQTATTSAITQIAGDVRTFTAQTEKTLGEVSRRNEEISHEQGLMTARYESAMAALTEDSEVIDARVSPDGKIYPTLGGRLRDMEEQSGSVSGELHETDALLWESVRETSAYAGSGILTVSEGLRQEWTDRRSQDRQIYAAVSSREGHLQEQADEIAGALLGTELKLHEIAGDLKAETEALKDEARIRAEHDNDLLDGLSLEEDERKNTDEEIRREISQSRTLTAVSSEHLQEQADELAGEIQRLTYEREADISRSASTAEELRQDISRSREHTQELYEQLREESDNLAGEIQRQTLQRETDQDEAQARREHENERRQLREDHEQEQLAELSQAVISGQVSMMTDRAKTKQGLSELGDRISHWETRSLKAEERIYEGLSSLSGGLIRVGLWVKLAEDSRRNEMSRNRECFLRLGEMSAENAAGILKLREEVSREGVKSYDRIRGLQEQINELASLKLSDIQEQREMSDRLAVIESDMDAILSEIDPEYVSAEDEEIDDMIDRVLAGETVTGDGEYDDPEFDGMIDEIFGVNP